VNDQTAALLQNLANKLGTTSEYLWGVLIRQAPISGTADLIQFSIFGIAAYFFYKWVTSENRDFSDGGDSWPGAIFIGLPLVLILIVIFFCFPNTLYAFFNPEYWALDHVLSAVKK
jgi:hypothetical protein